MTKDEKFLWAVQTMMLIRPQVKDWTQIIFLALNASDSLPENSSAFQSAADFQKAYLVDPDDVKIAHWLAVAASGR